MSKSDESPNETLVDANRRKIDILEERIEKLEEENEYLRDILEMIQGERAKNGYEH